MIFAERSPNGDITTSICLSFRNDIRLPDHITFRYFSTTRQGDSLFLDKSRNLEADDLSRCVSANAYASMFGLVWRWSAHTKQLRWGKEEGWFLYTCIEKAKQELYLYGNVGLHISSLGIFRTSSSGNLANCDTIWILNQVKHINCDCSYIKWHSWSDYWNNLCSNNSKVPLANLNKCNWIPYWCFSLPNFTLRWKYLVRSLHFLHNGGFLITDIISWFRICLWSCLSSGRGLLEWNDINFRKYIWNACNIFLSKDAKSDKIKKHAIAFDRNFM